MGDQEKDVIVVFTARSPERIIREGGSQAWVLNPVRAKLCKWVVCTQNRYNPDYEFSDATEPHGAGFLIGRVSGIQKSAENEGRDRWIIRIDKFARIDRPGLWDHGRNPVRYATLDELGIDPDSLGWEPAPDPTEPNGTPSHVSAGNFSNTKPLTIPEAKRGLALTFNVPPEAIEITIRG